MQILLNSIALEPNRWTKDKIPHFRLENLLDAISGAGFSALEVWQNHAALLKPDDLKRLAERGEIEGLSFPVVGMYPQFHLEGDERQAELERVDAMVGIVSTLGAEVLKLMPGCVPSAELDAAAWQRSVEFAQEMVQRTAQAGTIIPLETHGNTVADDPDALLRFIDEVGSDRLKVCWQPFDFQSTDKAIELYDRLAPHIVHLHLQGRGGGEMELLENSDIDYRRVLGHIFDKGFDGWLSLEFVRGCVVESPEEFDIDLVLENAKADRAFIETVWGSSS